MKKQRIISLDVIRTAAIALVVLLHATSLGGVFGGELFTPAWSISLFIRQLSAACVPLFLLLTGFLQSKKSLGNKYLLGILPLYASYFIISLISALTRAVYQTDASISPFNILYTILNFSANEYAWYFEMYIGLFLLIPFLNLAYSGLKTEKQKLYLIGALFFLTMMPELCKSFAPYYKNGGIALNIIPDFFVDLYPFTYYFAGAYIAEFRPKIKGILKPILLILAPSLPTGLCMLFSYTRQSYAWYMMNGNGAPTVFITSLTIFLCLYDLEFKPGVFSNICKQISESSFEMYLLSFIFDSYVYQVVGLPSRLEEFFSKFGIGLLANRYVGLPFWICVMFVFCGSFIAAYIVHHLVNLPVASLVSNLRSKKSSL